MKLISIPPDKYDDYRLDIIFDAYKWDPQFVDDNTIARHILILSEAEHLELERLTESLAEETVRAEELLNASPKLTKPLLLPRKIRREIKRMKNYQADKHIRLMRFDFHPIIGGGISATGGRTPTDGGGWAISEVNSDVPGGFAEASLMPKVAAALFPEENYCFKDFGKIITNALAAKLTPPARIALVHCTCYSDDRQVMQFLGDKLKTVGFEVIYAAADHLRFSDHEPSDAICILDGNVGKVDAIFRFNPLEWVKDIKPRRWQGYFDTNTLSCNHPVAIFAQTKRFPLVWDALEKHGLSFPAWRKLLPETLAVKDAKGKDGYIYKPVWGRVGEKISIPEACVDGEYKKILKEVRKRPRKYVAQKRFDSRPLIGENGEAFHLCIGSFSVEGKAAGYYARLSNTPRIDSRAADIPVLIEGRDCPKPRHCDSLPRRLRSEAIQKPRNYWIATVATLPRNDELYKIWAPQGARWVDWVRPVPFVAIGGRKPTAASCPPFVERLPSVTQICYLSETPTDTAIILDLPAASGIEEGIGLAKRGFRPIPIYNGTNAQEGAMALVDNHPIENALIWGAGELAKLPLPADAPPAFLLDSNRRHRVRIFPAHFDNSWDVYEQDLPSASYFLSNGIKKIIVRSEKLHTDLGKILYGFQKKGLEIAFTDGFEDPTAITIAKIHFAWAIALGRPFLRIARQ